MGLDEHGVRFILSAAESGVDFRRTVMIGRQELHVDASTLGRLLREFGHDRVDAAQLATRADGYAEPLFELVGAEDVESLDASSFEGATLVHDLNQPLPDALHAQFTAVLDSGSLEHVFDFPTAIRNLMALAAVDGHVLLITPTNNLMGHGFYQFSPDLLFRVFDPTNGYEVETMVAFEARRGARWYAVSDPKEARHRVELRNTWETYLALQARRVSTAAGLTSTPQQSDYAAAWTGDPFVYEPSWARRLAHRVVPARLQRALRRGFKRHSFTPIDPPSKSA
jgi:hypothetical protein